MTLLSGRSTAGVDAGRPPGQTESILIGDSDLPPTWIGGEAERDREKRPVQSLLTLRVLLIHQLTHLTPELSLLLPSACFFADKERKKQIKSKV